MHILDTSGLIEVMHETKTGQKIIKLIGSEPVVITVFSVNEFLMGAKKVHKIAFQKMLEGITVLDFDVKSAIKSANIESELTETGKKISIVDYFIAGICLTNNLPLITLDKHFLRIKELKTILVK